MWKINEISPSERTNVLVSRSDYFVWLFSFSKTEDLRSFYASVSCIKIVLDPLRTKLAVVSDTNSQGVIVLAATPPLKELRVKKMNRLYEIQQRHDILIVNPTMEIYIRCSNYITKLALQYVAFEDFHQYKPTW